MQILRNTFAVLMGLFCAGLIISLGIRLNPEWVTYEEFAPFKHWAKLLYTVRDKPYFFVTLLICFGIASTMGGVVTAILVKYAKVAYAILIGFILLFIGMLDILFNAHHPTFYKISIFLIFFPFAWLGGKVTEVIYKRKIRRQALHDANKAAALHTRSKNSE